MPQKKKSETMNLAGQLHSVVRQLSQKHKAGNQDAVLCSVLGVPLEADKRPVLLERIAQLQALPDEVRSALVDEGVPEKMLSWYGTIKAAVLTLCGSSKESLSAFTPSASLTDALARLDTCEAVLKSDDLTWDRTALEDLLTSIDATMAAVEAAKVELNESVEAWLTDALSDMRRVGEVTLTSGPVAGREAMFTLIGWTRCHPCPQSEDDRVIKLIERVSGLSARFGPLLRLGVEGVKLIAD